MQEIVYLDFDEIVTNSEEDNTRDMNNSGCTTVPLGVDYQQENLLTKQCEND